VSLKLQFRDAISECRRLFYVQPFGSRLEKQFQDKQALIGCMLMGLAGITAFVAFSIYFLIFLVQPTPPSNGKLARYVTTALSFYFIYVAYKLLLKKGSDESRQRISISFAYCLSFILPVVDLFRPIDQASYDLLPTVIVLLSLSGISRLPHRKGSLWLLVTILIYASGKWFLFGCLGPDAERIALDRSLIHNQFSLIQFVQILQGSVLSYLIFRANEARERVIFLREYQLGKAAEDRLQLLQGIGHDLRQPMTALMLHSDFARQSANSGEFNQMNSSLLLIEDNLHLMNSELTQVTELAASADPSAILNLRPLSVVPILDGSVNAFQPRAKASSIELVAIASLRHTFVFTDELLVRRCISNLVSNAFKFTEAKSSESGKTIQLGIEKFDSYAEITVEDSGIGIAPENLEKIWEPFFQVGNPARNSEMGFGLGLAHVRAAIDRMPGHSISVSSKLGEGTKFTIRVPLSNEAEIPVSTLPLENEIGDSSAWAFEGALILLVEDDVLLRSSLSRGFETWGARVAEADSVESAKKLIDSLEVPPDFAIVDFRLPDGDGRDVFKYIEESRAHTEGCHCHWICLTGEHSTNLKKLEGTRISVIRKPVNLAILKNLLIEIANANTRA
jgi:signal transduction histidine kinase